MNVLMIVWWWWWRWDWRFDIFSGSDLVTGKHHNEEDKGNTNWES